MFKFTKLKYAKTRRGIHVQGNINYQGRVVGTFEQQPFAACIPYFNDAGIRQKFSEAAMKQSDSDYSERLLREAEEVILNKQ